MKTIAAMIVIGVILLSAHLQGFDGILTAAGVGMVASLGGFSAGKKAKRSNKDTLRSDSEGLK